MEESLRIQDMELKLQSIKDTQQQSSNQSRIKAPSPPPRLPHGTREGKDAASILGIEHTSKEAAPSSNSPPPPPIPTLEQAQAKDNAPIIARSYSSSSSTSALLVAPQVMWNASEEKQQGPHQELVPITTSSAQLVLLLPQPGHVPMEALTVWQVGRLLHHHNLGLYVDNFQQNFVDGETLTVSYTYSSMCLCSFFQHPLIYISYCSSAFSLSHRIPHFRRRTCRSWASEFGCIVGGCYD